LSIGKPPHENQAVTPNIRLFYTRSHRKGFAQSYVSLFFAQLTINLFPEFSDEQEFPKMRQNTAAQVTKSNDVRCGPTHALIGFEGTHRDA
jgi:hypothetical protein